jgi:hypothetical protein
MTGSGLTEEKINEHLETAFERIFLLSQICHWGEISNDKFGFNESQSVSSSSTIRRFMYFSLIL